MRIAVTLLFIACTISVYAQERFTDVKCATYISYERGLSSGYSMYSRYTITRGKAEYKIHGHSEVGWDLNAEVPYEKEEPCKAKNDSFFSRFNPDLYYSVKEVYSAAGKDYTVYKHLDYNCYDIFCSNHGHMSANTGTTWFSPDFGMLIRHIHDMEYDVMLSMKEKVIPQELLLAIMKKAGFPDSIIQKYKADTVVK